MVLKRNAANCGSLSSSPGSISGKVGFTVSRFRRRPTRFLLRSSAGFIENAPFRLAPGIEGREQEKNELRPKGRNQFENAHTNPVDSGRNPFAPLGVNCDAKQGKSVHDGGNLAIDSASNRANVRSRGFQRDFRVCAKREQLVAFTAHAPEPRRGKQTAGINTAFERPSSSENSACSERCCDKARARLRQFWRPAYRVIDPPAAFKQDGGPSIAERLANAPYRSTFAPRITHA